MPLGEMTLPLNPQRQYWLQLISGKLVVGKEYMKPGDSLALTQEETLTLVCKSPSEFLFFDLV
jgi:redox-sensitive bicupin YhaK (pirin superfamily)